MKRIIVTIVFLLIVVSVFPETIDSLNVQREKLYAEYSEMDVPGKGLNKSDMEKSLFILKKIIVIDTKIIQELSNFNNKAKEYDLKINSLTDKNNSLSKDITSKNDLLFIIYLSSGTVVLLLIVVLIFLFIQINRYRKIRKVSVDYAEMLEKSDSNHQEFMLAKKLLMEKEKELTDMNTIISALEKEKINFKEKINDLQNSLAETEKRQTNVSTENNEELEETNINFAKIEKLAKMKELGIVTEEEFETLKQKFLNDF